MSTLAGEKREVRIVPFRGEYYKIRPERQHLVRNLIYPVPDPQFPFLGVHFTRLIHGGIEAGPNAVLAFAREGYRKTDVNVADLWDALTFSGLWRFLAKHKRMSWEELRRSFSRRLFCESLQKLVPEIREDDLAPGGAGVRAQAMSPDGRPGPGLLLAEPPPGVARAQRAQPRRHSGAGDRRGDLESRCQGTLTSVTCWPLRTMCQAESFIAANRAQFGN